MAALVLFALAWGPPAAQAELEVLGGKDARKVELQACVPDRVPAAAEAGAASGPCAGGEGEFLGGRTTLLLRNKGGERQTLQARFLPAGGASSIELPGDSERVYLEGEAVRSVGFFEALFNQVSGQAKGTLREKLAAALPQLARLALGRVKAATRLAQLRGSVAAVAEALAGKGGLDPGAVAGVAPLLADLIEPEDRVLRLGEAEAEQLLRDLKTALTPPVVDLAGGAMRSAFDAAAEAAASSSIELEAKQLQPFRLRFQLPPGEPPSAADGSLILTLGSGEPTVIEVDGSIRKFENLVVRPAALKIDSGKKTVAVKLGGAEVLDFLRYGSFGSPAAPLRMDGGGSVTATVDLPTPEEFAKAGSPNLADVTVELSDESPSPGKYTGGVSFSDLVPEAPAVSIELSSGRCFAWVILMAILGVVFGGVLTRVVAFAIRRRLLLKVLDQSVAAYWQVAFMKVDGQPVEVASWQLGDLFGEEVPDAREDEFRLQGLLGLRTSIETAKSGDDLDEDTARTLDLVARMQRWLRIEPAARRLRMVAEESALPDLSGRKWLQSSAVRDTAILREIAQREPVDVAAADDLVARLLRQAEWHHRFRATWLAAADNDELAGELKTLDEALCKDASKVGSSTALEQDQLDQKLESLIGRFGVNPGTMPTPAEPEQENGITWVEWKASPNLFTGWATLDGQSYGQLTRKAARGARTLEWKDLEREWDALGWSDVAWSFVALGLAGTVYALEVYDDTWGSWDDFLTAFIAGAVGTVAIDWAALPIFQSIRARTGGGEKKAPAESKAPAGKEAQGDDAEAKKEKSGEGDAQGGTPPAATGSGTPPAGAGSG